MACSTSLTHSDRRMKSFITKRRRAPTPTDAMKVPCSFDFFLVFPLTYQWKKVYLLVFKGLFYVNVRKTVLGRNELSTPPPPPPSHIVHTPHWRLKFSYLWCAVLYYPPPPLFFFRMCFRLGLRVYVRPGSIDRPDRLQTTASKARMKFRTWSSCLKHFAWHWMSCCIRWNDWWELLETWRVKDLPGYGRGQSPEINTSGWQAGAASFTQLDY